MTMFSRAIKNIEFNQTNFISIIGPITQQSMDFAIQQLHIPEIKKQMKQNGKIMIYINSQGGSVHAGNHFIQYLHSLQNQNITIECIGQNFMSMAFHIFQNCNHRMILENSIGMQHQMSLGIQGDIENIQRYLEMTQSINNEMMYTELEKIGISKEMYLEKIWNDWWIYGTQNLYENTADEIILYSCSDDLYNQYFKRKEYFNGISFYVKYNQCPLYKEIHSSVKEFEQYFDSNQFKNNVKNIKKYL